MAAGRLEPQPWDGTATTAPRSVTASRRGKLDYVQQQKYLERRIGPWRGQPVVLVTRRRRMRKTQSSTYTLRRRCLPNLKLVDEPTRAPRESSLHPTAVGGGVPDDYDRQRRNFEQRRLEHLRERWRVRGAAW